MGLFGRVKARPTPVPTPHDSAVRPKELSSSGTLPKLWSDDEMPMETTAATARLVVGRATLTIVSGLRAGEVFPLPEKHEVYIGRDRANDVRITDLGVSRIHCRLTRDDDGFVVQDLGSTNGTKVNGSHVGSATLMVGDRIALGPHAVLQLGHSTESEDIAARRQFATATRDPLTHAYKRAYFCERAEHEIALAKRQGSGLAMVLVDIDGLESLNERHGSSAGDTILREAAREISAAVRAEDLVARFGGDDFAILMRIENGAAHRTAERIRAKVEALRITFGTSVVTPTVSIGIAQLGDPFAGDTVDSLAALADRQLYRAKLLGRNRVSGG